MHVEIKSNIYNRDEYVLPVVVGVLPVMLHPGITTIEKKLVENRNMKILSSYKYKNTKVF